MTSENLQLDCCLVDIIVVPVSPFSQLASMEKQRPSDDNSVNHRSVQLSWDSQSSEIDDVEPRKTSVYDELCQEASNGVRDQAVTAASPIGTEFESKFQKLLQNLSGWQGVRWKVSDCSAISRLLTECENVVKSKSTLQQMDVDSEHTLIQKASQILHDLVCLHTPGIFKTADFT